MVLQFDVNKRKTTKIGNIEHRLLLTLFFFAVFGVISMISLAVVDARTDNFINATKEYINCEALGPSPGSCDRSMQELNKHGLVTLGTVTFALIGLLPFIVLIFIIDWSTMGKVVKKFLLRRRQYSGHCCDNQTSAVFSTFSPVPVTSVSNW